MVMRLSVDNHSALANKPYRTSDSARRKPTHRRWSGCLGALGVALAGAIWPVSAAAQETVSPPAPVDVAPRLFGLNGFGGVVLMDLGPINDRLADAGYPEDLPSLHAVVGGQGFGLFSRFLIGGSGFAILSRSADGLDDTEVSAGGAWGSFDFGYQAVRSDGFLLAPIASIGAYGMDVTIASTEGTTFDEALESPTRATTLTRQGIVGGISMLAQMVVIGRNSSVREARSGYSLGLRIGGLYGVPFRDWNADDADASDGPSLGLRGGYAALSVGVGTW